MCGICGYLNRDGKPVSPGIIRRMKDTLFHRGPDEQGIYVHGSVALGHQRLSIVDLARGHQPMSLAGSPFHIVYNGEIYNHVELRRELEARGHVFRSSHSDTEVLIHGYAEWGSDLPRRLNGMFAFALYDRTRRQLFLARDRFGEKPLYYYFDGRNFGFASELSALTEHRHYDRTVDIRSLQKFFAYSFLPAPNALYRHCRKLPGGHFLAFDLDSRRLSVDRYWQFVIEPDIDPSDEDGLAEELLGLLQQAVERRLISDVPLGIFLSGGIDSSATLALAARCRDAAELKTFTIGFTEKSFSEHDYADAVAKRFGSHHSVEVLGLDGARALIPEVLAKLDEPLGDGSIESTRSL